MQQNIQKGSNTKTHKTHKPKSSIYIYLSILHPRTISITICSIHSLQLVLWFLPLDHNDPCVSFQKYSNTTQCCDNAGVCMLPVIVAICCRHLQCFKSFKDVDDADDDSCVSDTPMVKVPVESDFVIFLWPQQQSKNLYTVAEVSVSFISIISSIT